MKKGLLLSVLSLIVLLAASCGPRMNRGKMTMQERQVTDFSGLNISITADVTVTVREGATPYVKITGFSDVLKDIKAEVRDNTLYIESKNDELEFNFDEKTKVEIVVSSLSSMALAGNTDLRCMGNLKADNFALAMAGAVDVKIEELNADALTVEAAGAGDLEIKKGTVRQAQYDLAGTADIKAYGLQCKEASASVAGAGDVKISVSEILHASISGMGDIKYKGKPQVTEDISGMGEVSDAN